MEKRKKKNKKLKKPKIEIMERSHRKVHSEASIRESALKCIEHETTRKLFTSHLILVCNNCQVYDILEFQDI